MQWNYNMYHFSIILLFSVSIAEETIKFAAVIYRHGDRTPVDIYPTDPYKNESFWPVRFGELTNTGKRQHYALGLWLRERYSHLLSNQFDPKQLKVRSTDVDRTLMSAQANLAGMYPPVGESVWNENLMWQPIPIHTVPEHDDEILAMKKNCKTYNQEIERLKNSKPFKDRLRQYQPLMDYLTSYTGRKIKDYDDIVSIFSTLYIETLNNLTLPSWTKAVYPDKMRDPACYSFSTSAATPLLARLRAGPLLKDVMTKIRRELSTNSSEHNELKVAIYSGHDFTIGTLLTALKVFDYNCPPFTATIFIELIYDTTSLTNFIRLSYRNSTEIVEPYVLLIPYCGKRCPVNRFAKLYENLLTVNFDEECEKQICQTPFGGLETATSYLEFTKFPAVVSVSFFLGVVLLIAVFVAHKIQSSRNNTQGSHYAYTNVNSSASGGGSGHRRDQPVPPGARRQRQTELGLRALWTCTLAFAGERTDQCTCDITPHTAMKILPLLAVLACIACELCAQAQDEGRPAPSRGLLKRGQLAKGKQTSTTTTPAPQEEAEYEEEYPEGEGEAPEPSTEAPPSSTEGKKLVAGGVRPFRSNTDLLEALKRRRAEAAQAKLHGQAAAASSAAAGASADNAAEPAAPAKSSYSKKRYNTVPKEVQTEEASAPAPAPAKPSRGRFGRPAVRSIQEDHEEQNESSPAIVKTGRSFFRRGGN